MKKSKHFITLLTTLVLFFIPIIAFSASNKTLGDLVLLLLWYFDQAIILLTGFAVVCFVFFVVRYFMQANTVKKSEAAQYVMWSLIGFFILISMWGLVNVLVNTFDLGSGSPGRWTEINNIFPK